MQKAPRLEHAGRNLLFMEAVYGSGWFYHLKNPCKYFLGCNTVF